MNSSKKIIVAITGASGSIYAQRLLFYMNRLKDEFDALDIVFSSNAKQVWKHEMQDDSYNNLNFRVFDNHDFNAPFASGSANYTTMIICPASMGTLGRIANGVSNDLISRAADVMLKERQQLILVARETPYNLIHLRNMTQLTESGAIIFPATPSFYSQPKSIIELVDTVVIRIIQIAGFDINSYRWGD
jgi:4-hydroxy-3-polyprenylbenzoate decarboxylase